MDSESCPYVFPKPTKLPLPVSSFLGLRQNGQIYVDKTDLVYELAKDVSFVLLTRPRRFGKSLLASTFAALFSKGIGCFSGLKIESLWKDTTYTVLHLDFSSLKAGDIDEFRENFACYLRDMFLVAGIDFRSELGAISAFRIWLDIQEQRNEKLVILVDEYDAPLTYALNRPEVFNAIQRELATFFSLIKSHSGIIRFFFLTGITKLQSTGIFSELNNLLDISYTNKYAQLLGFTEEEINHYFSDYVEKAASVLNLTSEQILKTLKNEYDGYNFSLSANKPVFSPWSVLNFFNMPEEGFEDYWYESGGQPKVLREYFKTKSLNNPANFNEVLSISEEQLKGSSNIRELSDIVLLTQAGYFTIKDTVGHTIHVGYPNQEVTRAMGRLYGELLLKDRPIPLIEG